MDHYEEGLHTWNKVAAAYEARFMDLELYDETYDAFCSLVPDQLAGHRPRILDVACGPGNITRYLLSRRPDFEITGIDASPEMIALAARNNPGARFLVMDGRQVSTAGEGYDGIVAGFFMPYLSRAECGTFIRDCSVMLNGEGVLYLSFVEGDDADSGYQTGSTGDRLYFHYHALPDIEQALNENGFRLRETIRKEFRRGEGVIEMHTILIAKKTH